MTDIQTFVNGVVGGSLSDAEVEVWMRNVYDNGLSEQQTVELTHAMLHSGAVLEWPNEWQHLVVDKHSTGGIGDKVSLVLAPALAACGLKCPMIAGRGLAHFLYLRQFLAKLLHFACRDGIHRGTFSLLGTHRGDA